MMMKMVAKQKLCTPLSRVGQRQSCRAPIKSTKLSRVSPSNAKLYEDQPSSAYLRCALVSSGDNLYKLPKRHINGVSMRFQKYKKGGLGSNYWEGKIHKTRKIEKIYLVITSASRTIAIFSVCSLILWEQFPILSPRQDISRQGWLYAQQKMAINGNFRKEEETAAQGSCQQKLLKFYKFYKKCLRIEIFKIIRPFESPKKWTQIFPLRVEIFRGRR